MGCGGKWILLSLVPDMDFKEGLQKFHSDVNLSVVKEVGGLNSQENSLPAFSDVVSVF